MSEQRVIDLRSDTVTLPSPEMRRAMAEAAVGDDVFGEDPTVRRLEAMAAERTGKEAALFVASGTMSNLVAILAHCGRGDEAIVGSESHILHYEVAGAAGVAGVQLRAVPNDARGAHRPGGCRGDDPRRERPPRRRRRCSASRTRTTAAAARRSRWRTSTRSRTSRTGTACACTSTARASSTRRWRSGTSVADALRRRPTRSASACRRGSAAPVGSVLCGSRRVHRARAEDAEDGRRRHAPGRRHRGGGRVRAGAHGGPPGRGPRQREAAGAGPRRIADGGRSTRRPSTRTSSSSACAATRSASCAR